MNKYIKIVFLISICTSLQGCWAARIISSIADVLSIISYFENNDELEKSVKNLNFTPKEINIDFSYLEKTNGFHTWNSGDSTLFYVNSPEEKRYSFRIKPESGYLPKISFIDIFGKTVSIEKFFLGDGSVMFNVDPVLEVKTINLTNSNHSLGGVFHYEFFSL